MRLSFFHDRFFGWVFLFLVLTACTSKVELIPTPSFTPVTEDTNIPRPSNTATAMASVTPTKTALPVPTSTTTPTATLPPVEDQIAFISDRDNAKRIIYRMNSDGSDVTQLAEITGGYFSGYDSPYAFSWSPDGQWIAYVSNDPPGFGTGDILIVNVYGTSMINLTNTPEASEDLPVWSPDGKWIAYVVENTVHLLDIVSMHSEQVAEILPDSVDIIQLSWSPDSSKLTFLAEGYATYGSEILSYTFSLVQPLEPFIKDPTNPNGNMAWSPDGNWFAFTGRTKGLLSREVGIYIIPSTGTGEFDPVAVHDSMFLRIPLDWEPNGETHIYSIYENRVFFIYSLDRSTRNKVKLTNYQGEVSRHPTGDLNPVWSPDGKRIAYVSSRDGNLEVYAMNANGSEQINLTNHPGMDWNPQWQPSR
jgi:Tol biopolymer transport system component